MAKQTKEKKKFKETGFGKFLIEKIPKAAGVVGDLLPSNGVFGIAKNLIGSAVKGGEIDAATGEELFAQLSHEEAMYALEVEDRASARQRQVEMAKSGKADIMMTITGVVGLIGFLFILYAAIWLEIKNKELFNLIAGNAMGAALAIFAFYYGSSKGSKDKTQQILNGSKD